LRIQVTVPEEHVSPETIEPFLEGVTRVNEQMIRQGQAPTSDQLLASGAVWRPEPMGDEHFDTGDVIARRKWGDCDDWAPNRTASLRASGEDPGAKTRLIPSGPSTFHAVTQRGSGEIEAGESDISVKAGMRPLRSYSVIGGGESIDVVACDPHDGRAYHGSLLPTVAPMSLHCGPAFTVRGCRVSGASLYEARCDLPIVGSPIVAMGHARRRRSILGYVPYAWSVTESAPHPAAALSGAISGALLCGEVMGAGPSLDRYKLMVLQAALHQMDPRLVEAHLSNRIREELAAHPHHAEQMIDALVGELQNAGCVRKGITLADPEHATHVIATGVVCAARKTAERVTGQPWRGQGPFNVGSLFGDIASIAAPVVHAVTSIVNAVPAPIRAVIAPASVVTQYAYEHPEQIPLFGQQAAQAKAIYENLMAQGHPNPAAVAAQVIPPAMQHPLASPVLQPTPKKIVPLHVGPAAPPAPAPRAPAPAAAAAAAPHVPPTVPLSPVPHAAVPASGSPGAPPGATHWVCVPGPNGAQFCRWQ
jgi:hypothetical protein